VIRVKLRKALGRTGVVCRRFARGFGTREAYAIAAPVFPLYCYCYCYTSVVRFRNIGSTLPRNVEIAYINPNNYSERRMSAVQYKRVQKCTVSTVPVIKNNNLHAIGFSRNVPVHLFTSRFILSFASESGAVLDVRLKNISSSTRRFAVRKTEFASMNDLAISNIANRVRRRCFVYAIEPYNTILQQRVRVKFQNISNL